jgi:DNA-binding winged helix-turn-helix (wHTH) protein
MFATNRNTNCFVFDKKIQFDESTLVLRNVGVPSLNRTLNPAAGSVLARLAVTPNQFVSKTDLMSAATVGSVAFGPGLPELIHDLRLASIEINEEGLFIRAVPRIGYVLVAEVSMFHDASDYPSSESQNINRGTDGRNIATGHH